MYLRLELFGMYLELGEQQVADEPYEPEDEPAAPAHTAYPETIFAEHDFEHTVPRSIGFV